VTTSALEAVLRRDRVVVATALAAIALAAWAYVVWLAYGMASMAPPEAPSADPMAGMDMGAMDMASAVEPGFRAWTLPDFAFTFAMWGVMMVGMMTPSVAPMVLLYAGVGRRAEQDGRPIAATGWFFAGYILVWIAFSLAATGAQWLLTSLSLLTPAVATESARVGGFVLIVVGLYQWTPLKAACLHQCQSPASFLTRSGGFTASPDKAVRVGISHGLYCLGCCWALMALLFVGGVMNVIWIAGIAILILAEKVLPYGSWISRGAGVALAGAGLWLIATSFA
jgi:predicted metal-binding membrane protein